MVTDVERAAWQRQAGHLDRVGSRQNRDPGDSAARSRKVAVQTEVALDGQLVEPIFTFNWVIAPRGIAERIFHDVTVHRYFEARDSDGDAVKEFLADEIKCASEPHDLAGAMGDF